MVESVEVQVSTNKQSVGLCVINSFAYLPQLVSTEKCLKQRVHVAGGTLIL